MKYKYKFFVSNNFGMIYKLYSSSNNLSDLKSMSSKFEQKGDCRWYIEDDKNEILHYGQYQKSLVDQALNAKKKGQQLMMATEDISCKRLLAAHGIQSIDTTGLLGMMFGGKIPENVKSVMKKDVTAEDIENALKNEEFMKQFKVMPKEGL